MSFVVFLEMNLMVDSNVLLLDSAFAQSLTIRLADGTVIGGQTVMIGIIAGLIFIATIAYVLYFGYD